jgi:hypothetical protein
MLNVRHLTCIDPAARISPDSSSDLLRAEGVA